MSILALGEGAGGVVWDHSDRLSTTTENNSFKIVNVMITTSYVRSAVMKNSSWDLEVCLHFLPNRVDYLLQVQTFNVFFAIAG